MALLLVLVAAGSDLADAIRAYQALDFRGARAVLVRIVDDPDLSPQDRIEALAYLGRAHAVLGEPVRAQRRFEAVLALDPDYTVSWEESPRIREVFERARDAARKKAEQPPELPPEASAGPPKKMPRATRPRPEKKVTPRTVRSPKGPGAIPAATPELPPAIPPPQQIEQKEAQESSLTTWLIVGGAALATVGVIVTIIAVGSRGGDGRVPTETWRLP